MLFINEMKVCPYYLPIGVNKTNTAVLKC